MDRIDHRERRRARPVLALGYGLVLGGCLGLLECWLRLRGNADPSIARRAPELLAYAGTWYALAVGVAFGSAAVWARIGAVQAWHTLREGPDALIQGCLVSLALPAALLLNLGTRLQSQPRGTRLMLLAVIGVVSILAGWFVARRLTARPGGPIARRFRRTCAPRPLIAIVLLSAAGSSIALVRAQAPLAARMPLEPATQRDTHAPNVVLILVDTLRADALGCYGAAAPTPTIDRLARTGTVFERAQSPASWTLPSVASLFTSTRPWKHGCTNFNLRIAELDSLAGAFAGAGYECLAAIGNPFVNQASGYARGFHVFDVDSQEVEEKFFGSRLFDTLLRVAGKMHGSRAALPWIDLGRMPPITTRIASYLLDEDLLDNVRRHAWPSGERPFFLYVQPVAPHTPYLEHPLRFLKNEPKLAEGNLDVLLERYSKEVQYTDGQIGLLLDELDQAGLLEGALVVITSDHGEEFLEHGGFEHGRSLYREVVEIPMVLSGPGVPAGLRVRENVELMDLAPTLLELAGVRIPDSFDGSSLVERLAGRTAVAQRVTLCETGPSFLTPDHRIFSATGDRYRVIRKRNLEDVLVSEEVFDLEADAKELSPIELASTATVEEVEALRAALDRYEAIERRTEGGQPHHDTNQLRNLGYAGEDLEETE